MSNIKEKPAMPNILLIDDNEEILTANSEYLTGHGFGVTCADTGLKAFACLNEKQFDCIVLDILLPDLDGFSICKAVRTITETPILFLSCLEETDDKIKGLTVGGDDYMTKPCSLKELAARISALLRRSSGQSDVAHGADFSIDYTSRIINAAGKYALLSEREFNLFMLFYENPGKLFSKDELIEKIWNGNAEANTVATLVARLRRKVEFAEDVIGAVVNGYGAGYKLTPPENQVN